MEEGFVFMNLSKYKRWRALLHRVIAKQQGEIEQTHPVCLHAADKYKKWRISIHKMITKQQIKNEQIKRKKTSLCFVNVFKFQENKFKIVQSISRK